MKRIWKRLLNTVAVINDADYSEEGTTLSKNAMKNHMHCFTLFPEDISLDTAQMAERHMLWR